MYLKLYWDNLNIELISGANYRKTQELESDGFQFKPIILSTSTESKLRTLDVYHPPVRTPRRTKSRQSNQEDQVKEQNQAVNEEPNLLEVDDTIENKEQQDDQRTVIEKIPPIIKKEMFVQTDQLPKQLTKRSPLYRPLDKKSIHFLRDITDDVLKKGVYTDVALEGIFSNHETMERELDRLREEVGMPGRPGLRDSIHSDEEALEALDSLQLDPAFKQEIINSLRLHSPENYHSTIIESLITNSTESSKEQKIVEKLNSSLEKEVIGKPVNFMEMFSPTNIAVENLEDIVEFTSTTSEVSDIEETEFDYDKLFNNDNDDKIVDLEINIKNNSHTESKKSITSLSAVKSDTDSQKEKSESDPKSKKNSNSGKQASTETEVKEYNNDNKIQEIKNLPDNKNNIEPVEEAPTYKELVIEKVKENEINTEEHPSLNAEISTEIDDENEFEENVESVEEEDDDEDDLDLVEGDELIQDVDQVKDDEKSSSNGQPSRPNSASSSDMSSIHTE